LDKLLLPPFVLLFFFRDEELGWMDDGTDGWKGRPPPDRLRILYIKKASSAPSLARALSLLHPQSTTAPPFCWDPTCSGYPWPSDTVKSTTTAAIHPPPPVPSSSSSGMRNLDERDGWRDGGRRPPTPPPPDRQTPRILYK